MRRQRDAAFTDEIITNIKQFQTDTDCDKPDEMIVSHAKEKTVNSIVTSQKNVGQFGNNGARGDGMSFVQTQWNTSAHRSDSRYGRNGCDRCGEQGYL